MARAPQPSLGERLQRVPKPVLYLILFLCTSVPLFLKVKVPNQPLDASIDFYANLMALPDGSRVLIGSDWTNSTRGESRGEFEALLRILMRKNIKFAVYSTGDAQAPQVARDTIQAVNAEHVREGGRAYKVFEDYVVLGFFPNSEGTNLGVNTDIRKVFSGRTETVAGSGPRDVLESPVFQGVKSVADFNYLVLVTGSQTNTITLERVNKTPLMFMVTGVMVPENQNYYASGQIVGLIGGIKGLYDIETLMQVGINNGPTSVSSEKHGPVPGWPGKTNAGRGTAYYPTLHFALALLIVAIAVGNIGMVLSRRGRR